MTTQKKYKVSGTWRTGIPQRMRRADTIVISDWLANCRSGQWTPFEAAVALKAALKKEGYEIQSSPQETVAPEGKA